jgi:hypothetical protein
MDLPLKSSSLFRRHIALPGDHGSWVFLFSPLLIGLFAGGQFTPASLTLVVAALAAFLLRQPATILVKIYSRRRPRRELPAAWFWLCVYALIAGLAVAALVVQGYSYLLILALPGIPVFAWHLLLVSRRAERRQMGVELVATGVLALAAPAAYWVGVGRPDPLGWWLLALVWAQSAASIVYAYLRLEQRELKPPPGTATRSEWLQRVRMGRRALLYTSFNLVAVAALSLAGVLPPLLPLPYALQWAESVWGTLRPAYGLRPTAIGLRQLAVSSLFTILFIVTW